MIIPPAPKKPLKSKKRSERTIYAKAKDFISQENYPFTETRRRARQMVGKAVNVAGSGRRSDGSGITRRGKVLAVYPDFALVLIHGQFNQENTWRECIDWTEFPHRVSLG